MKSVGINGVKQKRTIIPEIQHKERITSDKGKNAHIATSSRQYLIC